MYIVYVTNDQVNQKSPIILNATDNNIGLNDINLNEIDLNDLDFQNLIYIFLNQNKILKQYAEIKCAFDKFINVVYLKFEKILNKIDEKNKNESTSPAEFKFEIIDCAKKLDQLEEELKDNSFRNRFLKKFELVCGTSGKLEGLTCCYNLIDHIFTRNVFTKCSWSGGARGTDSKFPFKSYIRTIEIFEEIIRKADPKFSKIQSQNFFSTIMKNSRQRLEAEIGNTTRSSSKKARPKNLKYKKREVKENCDKKDAVGNQSDSDSEMLYKKNVNTVSSDEILTQPGWNISEDE